MGVWSYKGEAAWRKLIEQWFGSLDNERVKVKFDDIQTTAVQGFGMVDAVVTYAAIAANGEDLRNMQNRLTWVLKQKNDIWKIIHEHTSVPVDFDHMKAILQRNETRSTIDC